MTLSNIEPEDLIADPSVRAQRFLNFYATCLQQTAFSMWKWNRWVLVPHYSQDEVSAHYALARRATWRAAGWPESEAP